MATDKYTELQRRKIISAYGGIGSIIETRFGALMIEPFEKWRYFAEIKKGNIDPEYIDDERLLKRLKSFFTNTELKLVRIPDNVSKFYGNSSPQNPEKTINSTYFPKWMYCTNCGRFSRIDEWWNGWEKFYNGDKDKKRESFVPPKCYICYKNAQKGEKRFFELEQVRFIMTAPNGEICDLPWDRWTLREKKNENEINDKDEGIIKVYFDRLCCDNQELYYIKSDKFADFSGVRIQCRNPKCPTKGKHISLSGLFGLRISTGEIAKDKMGTPYKTKDGKDVKIFYKPVIRTSNSVYYPLITNSLFLPYQHLTSELVEKIKTLHIDGELSAQQIFQKLKTKYSLNLSDIINIISPDENIFISENQYRLGEYNYLINQPSPDNENLVYVNIDIKVLEKIKISKLLKIKRLKLTSVQTGYTRQEPLDKDLFAQHCNEFIEISKSKIIKAKFTSINGNQTKYLPAIESFGEGIFIDFDRSKFDEWFDKQWDKNEIFTKRIKVLQKNLKNIEFGKSIEKENMSGDASYLTRFIVFHTFSHLLIKEFEFVAGYPATSMIERLYIDKDDMQGILIYTIAGSEGSYGGLINQAEPIRLEQIIISALNRAKDCASDPVCYNTEEQGVGGLNLAACYSCTLIPETSCEEFNCLLDRALLIDNKYGYFSL